MLWISIPVLWISIPSSWILFPWFADLDARPVYRRAWWRVRGGMWLGMGGLGSGWPRCGSGVWGFGGVGVEEGDGEAEVALGALGGVGCGGIGDAWRGVPAAGRDPDSNDTVQASPARDRVLHIASQIHRLRCHSHALSTWVGSTCS